MIPAKLLSDEDIKKVKQVVRQAGGNISHDKDAGTLECHDVNNGLIFRGIEGYGAWICKFYNTELLTWESMND